MVTEQAYESSELERMVAELWLLKKDVMPQDERKWIESLWHDGRSISLSLDQSTRFFLMYKNYVQGLKSKDVLKEINRDMYHERRYASPPHSTPNPHGKRSRSSRHVKVA